MNKKFLSLCFWVLIMLSTTGCSSDNQIVDKDIAKNISGPKASIEATAPIETEEHETSGILETESPDSKGDHSAKGWQEAYVEFLSDFMVTNDKGKAYYSLRDLDNDGVPELVLDNPISSESADSILTVYKYSDSVYKAGDYTLIGAGGLHISDNSEFPGLFHVVWGGGVENYWYLTIEEGELISEHVRRIDLSGLSSEHTEFSDNAGLIEETVNVYESDKFPNNLLEMHLINDDNINEILSK